MARTSLKLNAATDQLQEALTVLRTLVPVLGVDISNFDEYRPRVQVDDINALRQIPGIPIVEERERRYHVCKYFRGVMFYCWTNAEALRHFAKTDAEALKDFARLRRETVGSEGGQVK